MIFNSFYSFYSPYSFPFYSGFSSYAVYFLIALIAALKSSEADFQFYPVFSKPFDFPYLFSLALTCFAIFACYLFTNRFASELNYFLLDINTNLQALACFSKAFLWNFLPQPYVH